jgi:hypothetical protein
VEVGGHRAPVAEEHLAARFGDGAVRRLALAGGAAVDLAVGRIAEVVARAAVPSRAATAKVRATIACALSASGGDEGDISAGSTPRR